MIFPFKVLNCTQNLFLMKKLFVVAVLQCAFVCGMAQEKINQTDSKNQKQGAWIENVPELRGEPGYSWEGVYRNNRKEGAWKKYTPQGTLIADETYKNNVLNGPAKYYFPDGKLSMRGNFIATDIDGQKDTIKVIDAVTSEEKEVEIVRQGNPVMHGEWRVFDEESGKYVTQYYEFGELKGSPTPAAPQDSVKKPQGNALPHQQQTGKKKRQ